MKPGKWATITFQELVGGRDKLLPDTGHLDQRLATIDALTTEIEEKILKSSYDQHLKLLLYRKLEHARKQWLEPLIHAAPGLRTTIKWFRQRVRRSDHDFSAVFGARDQEKSFISDVLARSASPKTSRAQWLILALWSAATRSLLLESKLLAAFAEQVINDKCRIIQVSKPPRFFIRLELRYADGYKGPFNQYCDGMPVRIHYFQPDILTLALLQHAFSRPVDPAVTAHEVGGMLGNWLGPKHAKDPFASLAKLGLWSTDNQAELRLPEALLTALSGAGNGAGVDDACFAAMFRTQPPAPTNVKLDLASERHTPEPVASSHRDFEELARLVRSPKNAGKLLADLIAFCTAPVGTTVIDLMCLWFINLLQRTRKRSTIITYFSRIASRLYEQFEDIPLASLDSDDLAAGYEDIVTLIHDPASRQRVAQTIDYFQSFAATSRMGVEALDGPIAAGSLQHTIRSRFVPNLLFQNALLAIDASQPKPMAKAMRFAMLLAYRAGLRRTEVCMLRSQDFELSDELWLFVTKNRYGALKSPAARRRIRLASVFTQREMTEIKGYLARCLDPKRPIVWQLALEDFDARVITQICNAALMHVTGSKGWTFHHLRHSCANALFLIAVDEPELCEDLFGWNKARHSQILRCLVPSPSYKQGRFNGIGAFLGHACFEPSLANYIHLVQDIAAQRRAALKIPDDDVNLLSKLLPSIHLPPTQKVTVGVLRHMGKPLSPWIDQYTVQPEMPAINLIKTPENRVVTPNDLALLTLGRARIAIEAISRGDNLAAIANQTELPPSLLEDIQKRIDRLSTEGTDRAHGSAPSSVHSRKKPFTLPKRPISIQAQADCKAFLIGLWDVSKDDAKSEAIRQFMRHAYAQTRTARASIAFRTTSHCRHFIDMLLAMGVERAQLHLKIELAQHKDQTLWQNIFADIPLSVSRKLRGTAKSEGAFGSVALTIKPFNATKASSSVAMSKGWRSAIQLFYILEGWSSEVRTALGAAI